ncbi:M48 family metalloprotease [candidate division KSB1 bacterium]
MTVTVLKLSSLLFFIYFCLKCLFHIMIFNRLRKNHRIIRRQDQPVLYKLSGILIKKTGLKKMPSLYYFSNRKPLIFTIGIFNPAVFISPRLLQDLNYSELTAVLTHEFMHIKRRDGLYNRLMQFIPVLIPTTIILFFGRNILYGYQTPLFWFLLTFIVLLSYRLFIYEGFNFDRESSCDDLTLKIIKDPLVLAESIIKVWESGRHLPEYNWRLSFASVRPFAAGISGYEGRVKRLVNYRKPYLKMILKRLVIGALAISLIPLSIFIWDYSLGRISSDMHFIFEKKSIKITVEKVIIKNYKSVDGVKLHVWSMINEGSGSPESN